MWEELSISKEETRESRRMGEVNEVTVGAWQSEENKKLRKATTKEGLKV